MPNSDPRIPIPQDNVFWMVKQELDALHAEIETLRIQLDEEHQAFLAEQVATADAIREADALRAENEQLRTGAIAATLDRAWDDVIAERAALHAENERLRAVVQTAAAMVKQADPDLSSALLRQLDDIGRGA